MARPRGMLGRALALAAAAAAGLFVLVSWADRRRPLELLPAGAACALEVVGLADLAERLEGTRFAALTAASATRAWLEQSAAAAALDAARADIGRAVGYTPARRHLLDLVGTESAAAWYPTDAAARGPGLLSDAPWIAAGRLSWRAWGIASVLRASLRLGLGGSGIASESVAGTTVVTLGAPGEATHLFLVGRVLVAASDPALARRAALLAAGRQRALAAEESWTRVFARLPPSGALRLWARGDLLQRAAPAAAAAARAAGAVVTVGFPIAVDFFVDAPGGPVSATSPPPALALAGDAPLVFFSTGKSLPAPLAAVLARRAEDVARFQRTVPAPALPPPGTGYAFALTSAGEGLFPLPEGLLAVAMRDEAAAQEALRLLFPAGARAADTRLGTALTTRESLALAGETELWGVAAGNRLMLATRRSLLDALPASAEPTGVAPNFVPRAEWPLDTVGTVGVARLLPVLRRYAAPLNGLVRARHPGLPDVANDLSLLAAVRSAAVTSGTSRLGTLARLTIDVGDLPAAAADPALPPRP